MAVVIEKAVAEDLNLGYGAVTVTMPSGTASGTKIGLQTFAKNHFSLKETFGAVGDGATNDTAAVVAAITAMKVIGKDGVLIVPPGIYMVDPDVLNLTGNYTIQIRGSQGSYIDTRNNVTSILTSGSIIRARGAGTTLVNLSGNFRSIHDIVFDGAGLVDNVALMAPVTSHYNFYRTHFVRPKLTTGVIFNIPNAGNSQVDNVSFHDCVFHGDPVGGGSVATGYYQYGFNALLNSMHNCQIYNTTNSVVLVGGGLTLHDCNFLIVGYACVTITSGHDTVRIQDCYTESACTYFIYHSVTTSNGNFPLIVSGNMVNNPLPQCNFSTGQPVTLLGNSFYGNVSFDATGRYKVTSMGNNLNGSTNTYTGAGLGLVNRFSDQENGTYVTALTDASTSVTGILTASTVIEVGLTLAGPETLTGVLSPTALSGNVNDYNPTNMSISRAVRIDPNGAARNITGLITTGAGRRLTLFNISAVGGENLVLKHQDAGSAAANRIIGPNQADHTIRPGGGAEIQYDGTSSRWRIVAA